MRSLKSCLYTSRKVIGINIFLLGLSIVTYSQGVSMKEQMQNFDLVLKKDNPLFYASLQPPIKVNSYLDSLQQFYGRQIHPSKVAFLSELFGWHNGTNKAIYIAPFTYFYSFSITLKFMREQNSIYAFKQKGLFPVFLSNGSEVLCINLFNESLVLIQASAELGTTYSSAFDSFISWMELSTKCYEEKLFYHKEIEGVKYLTIADFDSYVRYYKLLNPMHGKLFP